MYVWLVILLIVIIALVISLNNDGKKQKVDQPTTPATRRDGTGPPAHRPIPSLSPTVRSASAGLSYSKFVVPNEASLSAYTGIP